MIRFIIGSITLVLLFIIGVPLWLVLWIIRLFNKKTSDMVCLRIVQWAMKVILFICGTKTTVTGLENIPKDEAVLFVGNHQGIFDILVSYSRMPRLTGYISKKEMDKAYFIRRWMRLLHCLFLDRHDLKEGLKTILEGVDLIKNQDVSIVIFPEGTRSKNEEMAPFKEGAFKMATKSGCKIIPMVQKNTRAIFENQFPRIKKAHTALAFGKPIDVNALSKEDKKFIGAYVQNIMKEMYQELDVEYEYPKKKEI